MKIVTRAAELRAIMNGYRKAGLRCGFVPTMGNLHPGHLALVDAASEQCDRVIVSIFVNPMQFGPDEDLDAYPNTPEDDEQGLREHHADLLYRPSVNEIYPQGTAAQTRVEVPVVSEMLEGFSRPGHFTGVATVVNRLFNLVQPDVALFGKKDYQQYLLIKKMVADLAMNVVVQGIETVRLDSGLALSSRNNYLSESERVQAAALFQTLLDSAAAYRENPQDAEKIIAQGLQQLKRSGFDPDYLSIRRQDDLQKPAADDKDLVVLGAAWMGRTRLLDNLEFTIKHAK